MNTNSASLIAGSPSTLAMNNRYGKSTWFAASPTPSCAYIRLEHLGDDLPQFGVDLFQRPGRHAAASDGDIG